MERLTFEGSYCDDIALCGEVPFGSYCEDGTCWGCRTWKRLKAIEDILGDEYDLDCLREYLHLVRK